MEVRVQNFGDGLRKILTFISHLFILSTFLLLDEFFPLIPPSSIDGANLELLVE